jgi:hypothetical protein
LPAESELEDEPRIAFKNKNKNKIMHMYIFEYTSVELQKLGKTVSIADDIITSYCIIGSSFNCSLSGLSLIAQLNLRRQSLPEYPAIFTHTQNWLISNILAV